MHYVPLSDSNKIVLSALSAKPRTVTAYRMFAAALGYVMLRIKLLNAPLSRQELNS